MSDSKKKRKELRRKRREKKMSVEQRLSDKRKRQGPLPLSTALLQKGIMNAQLD